MTLISPPATQVSPPVAQAKRSTSVVPWLIAGGLIGAVAGVIIMMVAHNKGEREQNITELATGYTGFGLLVLGVLTAIVGLFIIAATKHDPS
jgi:hypothetical protein